MIAADLGQLLPFEQRKSDGLQPTTVAMASTLVAASDLRAMASALTYHMTEALHV